MTTRDKILNAAKEEFLLNGYDATRMRSISQRSEVNKGLLHYYFKSKDALITEVFQMTFSQFFASIGAIANSEGPFAEKLELIVHNYIDFLSKNPRLPWFILHEMERSPAEHSARLKKAGVRPPAHLLKQLITQGKEQGAVRKDLDERHFMLSLMSLMLFPFVGKGMLMYVEGSSERTFKKTIQDRKKEVTDILLRYVQP